MSEFNTGVFGEQNQTSSYNASSFARELLALREHRMCMIWRVLNRTYNDHLIQPQGMPDVVWEPLKKRFTVTDLASPVLSTINSATYGGKVTRDIKDAVNIDALKKFVAESNYNDFLPEAQRYAVAYGTSYISVGRRTVGHKGKRIASLQHLHPISTIIVVNDDDVEVVNAVITKYESHSIEYRADGIYRNILGKRTKLDKSDYGFIPVSIGRGRRMDAASPYGQDLIWPAVEETKQITALMCDLMVLERNQSYSTLVLKGTLTNRGGDDKIAAPWIAIEGDEEFDAKWISPDAKIAEINSIIESKFERAATQCQVPVELFVRAKAGTQQAAGAAALAHRPLYNLVVEQQRMWRDVEHDLLSRISAFLEYEKTGRPVDLEKHRETLVVDIDFEHETHPAINQSEAQTIISLRDAGLMTNKTSFKRFNNGSDWEEQFEIAQAEAKDRELKAFEMEQASFNQPEQSVS